MMDVHSGYNQIPMATTDEENISFIVDWGIYCYQVMVVLLMCCSNYLNLEWDLRWVRPDMGTEPDRVKQ